MTTIYVRSVSRSLGMARISTFRPRKTKRKAHLSYRCWHGMVPLEWLEKRHPKGGIVYCQEVEGDVVMAAL